jgi:hypothetical protein
VDRRRPAGGGTVTAERFRRVALVVLAVAASAAFLINGWVQDDAPRILYDRRVQEWSGLWIGFFETYWPPPSRSGLFRPLSTTLYTLQWMLGQGRLIVFHLVTLAAYLLATFGVWRVARRLLPEWPAWVAAALFAVHPLHTEVMAVAVNQSETLVVALLCFALLCWWDLATGARARGSATLLLLASYLAALGFKEHALVLPALLLALDLCAWPELTWRERLRARGATFALLVVAGMGWWAYRSAIVGGIGGAAAAEGLRSEGFTTRLVLMLGVVPEWARLFLWPASLSADYAPRRIDPDLGWGVMQWLGLALIVGWGAAVAWSWRRARWVAFSLLWIAIGLAPVSNVLIPTGVLLAERTLFLPSVGVVLLLGALLATRARWWVDAAPAARVMAMTFGCIVVGLALARDWRRGPDWRDPGAFVKSQLRDSPDSWRAHTAYGIWEFEEGDRRVGEEHLRYAIALWPHHARPYHLLADYYRGDGLCLPALALYTDALAREPDRPRQRISMAACLLWEGRYPESADIARGASMDPRDRPRLDAIAVTADSATRAGAPVHSVRLPASRDHAGEVGWRGQAPLPPNGG